MFNDISPEGYSSPLLPFTPKQQVEAGEAERKDTLAQKPLLRDTLKRLETQIAKTDSIQEAKKLAKKHDISVETALVALSEVNERLSAERGYIEARISRAIKT